MIKEGDKIYLAKDNMFSTLRAKIRILFYLGDTMKLTQELLDQFIDMINMIEEKYNEKATEAADEG